MNRTLRSTLLAVVSLLPFSVLQAQQTVVTLRVTEGRLNATWQMPAAAMQFNFEDWNIPQRSQTWLPDGDAWNFDGEVVTRKDGSAFDSFTLALQPDNAFYDRHYPAIDPVCDAGWMIFPQALRAGRGTTLMNFEISPQMAVLADGVTHRAPVPSIQVNPDRETLIYLGSPDAVHEGAITLVHDDDVPEWLINNIRELSSGTITALTERLGVPITLQPVISVAAQQQVSNRQYRGNALRSGVISLSLRGFELTPDNGPLRQILRNLGTHETVHLLNGAEWTSSDNAQQPWLDEGSADYFTTLINISDEELPQTMTNFASACLERGDRRPLDGSRGTVAGRVPYNCGFLLQLLADCAIRQNGNGDIFTLWHNVFASNTDHVYNVQDSLDEGKKLGGEPFARAAELLLGDVSSVDKNVMIESLNAAGVKLSQRPMNASDAGLPGKTLNPVLASLCTGQRGFTTYPDRIELDTGNRCGTAIANNPVVVSVNGTSLIADPLAAYAIVRDTCAAHDDLIFAGPDGVPLKPVPCTAVLEDSPSVLSISAFP